MCWILAFHYKHLSSLDLDLENYNLSKHSRVNMHSQSRFDKFTFEIKKQVDNATTKFYKVIWTPIHVVCSYIANTSSIDLPFQYFNKFWVPSVLKFLTSAGYTSNSTSTC